MFPFTLLLLVCQIGLTSAKCDSNSFCFSPKTSINITISCLKQDVPRGNLISLKWKTLDSTSSVLLENENATYKFMCGHPESSLASDPLIDLKQFKLEKLRDENVTSCQVDFYQNLSSLPSFLKYGDLKSEQFELKTLCNPKVEGLSKEFKRFLVKTHAILMLLGWLFFVPTGFLFARFGKDLFKGQKLVGLPVWFQIHRTSTFLGVSCVCISILCILLSTNWSWKGTGSGAWYWTQWHTDLGTISSILAVSQPLNSLLRCPPTNSQRSIFNWAHRIVGLASYLFAVAAIYVAAANYRKTWSEPLMEMVLTSVPTVLCLATGLAVSFLESRQRKAYEKLEMIEKNSVTKVEDGPHVLRTSWLFLVVGTCFGVATSLSLLVANGFKNG